jgi:ribonuclease BN (tRNA processing enzyme)
MRLTVVGCGMASPDPDRVCAGFYVETNGLKLLLDCGPGVVHRMANLGLDWRGITHLCITHFHNDHIGDIPTLFFAWKWGTLPGRKEPLTVLGPRGIKRKLTEMATAMGNHVNKPGFDLEVEELAPNAQRLLGDVVHFKTMKTPHTAESLAFRIDAPGGSVGYTGDTGESADVAAFFQNVRVLIMECSLPDEHAMATHLTPSSAARMANIAQPEQLVITHVYPQLERTQVPQLMRTAGWTGTTIMAHDGLRLG